AQDEVAPRRRQALQGDRHRQDHAAQGRHEPHPREEAVEGDPTAQPRGPGQRRRRDAGPQAPRSL
ncbi:MAG: LSU ribosomal protein L35p, partial [uncultured Acidimicrobiales bacterium]